MKSLFIGCLLVLISINLVSCGDSTITADVEDSTQSVEGDINININWNLDEFEAAFTTGCEAEFDTQEEIDDCVADKISGFVDLLNTGINQTGQGRGNNE